MILLRMLTSSGTDYASPFIIVHPSDIDRRDINGSVVPILIGYPSAAIPLMFMDIAAFVLISRPKPIM